jgi:hypothetical protein
MSAVLLQQIACVNGGTDPLRLGDVQGKADAWDRRDDTASPADHMQLHLSPRGGFVGWFRK